MPKKAVRKKTRTVKLLLNESVKSVGRVGDLVEVTASYARNHLVPNHLAVEPTPKNVAAIEIKRLEVERAERERRERQTTAIARLSQTELTIVRRANERGHLFGSVSATDIVRALEEQGFEDIEASDVHLPGKLDRIDTFTVEIVFAEDLRADVKIYVAPDPESKAAMDAYAKDHPAPAPVETVSPEAEVSEGAARTA